MDNSCGVTTQLLRTIELRIMKVTCFDKESFDQF